MAENPKKKQVYSITLDFLYFDKKKLLFRCLARDWKKKLMDFIEIFKPRIELISTDKFGRRRRNGGGGKKKSNFDFRCALFIWIAYRFRSIASIELW